MRVGLLVPAILCGLATAAFAEDDLAATYGKKLTGDEIRAAFTSGTEHWKEFDAPKSLEGSSTAHPDGTSEGRYIWDNRHVGTATGSWSVKGDTFCWITLTIDGQPNKKGEECRSVYVKDGVYSEINANGKLTGQSTFVKQ